MHKHEFKALPKGTKFLNKRIIAGVTGFCPNSLQKTAIAPTLKFGLPCGASTRRQ